MSTIDQVRALFVPGETVVCVDNTYHRASGKLDYIGREWTVGKVGKSYWRPADGSNFQGSFPERVRDVVHVDELSATWKIDRVDAETGELHTVTYAKAA